ncbi:MAG: recombinase family protein [Lachnospiraceae bacterium]|jgi:site-specific DNA recombinase|nr:recombinase family protein [Lachnospiraceae bacterium]
MDTNLNTDVYNADIYLRLSREDGDKEESDSITNQRELILEFLKSREDIKIHAVRVDDGYSGVNFERPAFQQMLEDIKTGEVNCVVTKDLSRFGRNHIEVGKYIEKIFPYLGVRFIAINDNYDSMTNDTQISDIIIPFKNLINDAYCRDISIKIRSNLEVKRKRGDFVGPFAPYGYQKSETDKNKLEIDEEAAEVVRFIFRLYLQGNNAYKIAEKLNKKNILTPMDYKKENGSAFYTGFKKNLKSQWTHMHVLRILGNPVYAGILVQGKETTPNYKVKKKVKRDQSKWSQVENTHEAIITSVDFQNAQEQLRMDTRTGTAKEKVYYLSGIVKCGDCGANMVRKTVPSGKRKFIYYVCGGHKGNKNICSSHSINAEALEESVLKLLNHQITNVSDLGQILDKLDDAQIQKGEIDKRRKQVTKKKEEVQRYDHLRLDLYEDYKNGLIMKEEYLELKQIYEKRTQAAEQVLEAMEVEMAFPAGGQRSTCDWINEFKKYGYLECLSREVVVSLIEQILIYEKKEGERYPRIEIRFKYADEFQASLSLVEELREEKEGAYGEDE